MMTTAKNISAGVLPGIPPAIPERKETIIFGVPIGKLGLLTSILIGTACGLIVFFGMFFFSIVGMVIYDTSTGTSMANLNLAYRNIAAPVGLLAMLASLTYLIGSWARRKFSHEE